MQESQNMFFRVRIRRMGIHHQNSKPMTPTVKNELFSWQMAPTTSDISHQRSLLVRHNYSNHSAHHLIVLLFTLHYIKMSRRLLLLLSSLCLCVGGSKCGGIFTPANIILMQQNAQECSLPKRASLFRPVYDPIVKNTKF